MSLGFAGSGYGVTVQVLGWAGAIDEIWCVGVGGENNALVGVTVKVHTAKDKIRNLVRLVSSCFGFGRDVFKCCGPEAGEGVW